jgi:hypothetical protein
MRELLGFPDPVNEKAARTVAAVVALLAATALATGAHWLLVVLAYGFWARVLTGPRLSPLGRFATKVAAPRLGSPKYVPGPPKRFAQGIGAALTTTGAIGLLAFGSETLAIACLAALLVAATLESVFALCLGCKIFAGLIRLGVVPQTVCERCVDYSAA